MQQQRRRSNLPAPSLVTAAPQLKLLLDQLSNQRIIAVDTESNSLHAYQERVCLIQFSVPGTDYLVDPLAKLDLSPLGRVFANPKIEKILHAAEYDVMCLRRDYGWTFANLFDTMWAARVLGWPRTGLGNILREQFGIQLDKRMQRHDWGRRPLSSEALAYARLDTHYLLPLREQMLAELKQKGRLEQAQDFFAKVAQTEPNFRSFDPDCDLWRVKGVWDLEPEDRAVLRELLIWRNTEARKRKRPTFKVVNDQTLVALAQARPQSLKHLEGINGFKSYHQRRYGRKILKAIAQGVNASVPQPPPRPPRPADDVLERYEALRSWRRNTASQRGVDPDVIVSNATLWTLAQHAPRSRKQLADLDALSPWEQKAFGEALLSVLRAKD